VPLPSVTACDPLASGEGVNDAGLPVFRVIAVGLAVRFAVVHKTEAEQVEAFSGMVQEVAERVPEGPTPDIVVNVTLAP